MNNNGKDKKINWPHKLNSGAEINQLLVQNVILLLKEL